MTLGKLKTWYLALAAAYMLVASATVHAQPQVSWTHDGPLLPDSSNFVTASLLVASPGEAIYSQLGHTAIRMECPIHDLDYCFNFEQEPDMGGIIKFFAGRTNAHMKAEPTEKFLNVLKQDGRQVMQYTLNLTNHQKQELWRMLDNDYVDEEMRQFNFLQNNCSSVSLMAIENAMTDETIDFNGWPEPFKLINGAILKYETRKWPWLQFWCLTFLGTEGDLFLSNERRTGPELIASVIKKASIVSADGVHRPMLTGEKQLLPLLNDFKASPVTPTIVFGLLLLVVVLIALAQLQWRLQIIGQAIDVTLMLLVTAAGLFLMYTSFISGLFGIHWNWYLIPFNPLPLIIWLVWRKRNGFFKVYLLYAVVLVLFILATPLSEQLDLPHQLITATLTVRCFYNYYDAKRTSKMTAKNIEKRKQKI